MRRRAAELAGVTTLPRPRFLLVPGARLSGAGGVGWRLVGANNRGLGRGARTYPDPRSALAAIDRVRVAAGAAPADVERDPDRGGWSWRLDEGTTALVVSGRRFRHEWEARRNLARFRQEAPSAPMGGPAGQEAVPGRARPRRPASC